MYWLFESAPQWWMELLLSLTGIILTTCLGCVEAGKAGGVHCLILEKDFLVLLVWFK